MVLGLEQDSWDNIPLVMVDRLWMENVNPLTEWRLNKLSFKTVNNGVIARYTPAGILSTMTGDMSIIMEISRNSHYYRNVFTMPVLSMFLFLIN